MTKSNILPTLGATLKAIEAGQSYARGETKRAGTFYRQALDWSNGTHYQRSRLARDFSTGVEAEKARNSYNPHK